MKKRPLLAMALVLLSASVLLYLLHSNGESYREATVDSGRSQLSDPRNVLAPSNVAHDNKSASTGSTAVQPHLESAPVVLTEAEILNIRSGIPSLFGHAVEGLNLPADQESRVWEYLFRRAEAGYIARRVAVEQQTNEPLPNILKAVLAEVDEEVRAWFSPQLMQDLQAMVAASLHVNNINQSVSNALAAAGHPLSDEQVLPLAKLYLEAYGKPGSDASVPMIAGVDDNGLMQSDHKLLAIADRVLQPPQISALRSELIRHNLQQLSISRAYSP